MSGDEVFNGIVQPLISAFEHWRKLSTSFAAGTTLWPAVSLLSCVTDAPLVLADGPPDEPELSLEPWIRLKRQESTSDAQGQVSTRSFIVDVVHRSYVHQYVEQAVDLAEVFAARAHQHERVLSACAAWVDDLTSFGHEHLRLEK